TIWRCSRERHILPPVNADPAACRLRIGNVLRYGETGIPDARAGAPELEGSRSSTPFQHSIEPALMVGMMDGQRHPFLDTTPQAKGHRIGLANFVQRPVLVVGLQRQTPKLLDLRACVGVANCLVDPRRANLDMGKRL